jgi:TM2 domain-containing membrane protein YozV
MTTSTTATLPATPRNWHLATGLILFAWFALIFGLSLNGAFVPPAGEPPRLLLLTGAVSLGLFALAWRSLPAFRAYILGLDLRLLILLHGMRTLGLGFVMLYMVDQLPMLFAFLAGFGDALTAVAAIVLGYLLFTRRSGLPVRLIRRWNTFGLVDFVIAVSIGVLTRANGLLASGTGVDSDLMSAFPFAIIPAFLVQVFTLTHIIIYLQLRHNWQGKTNVVIR